VVIHSKSGSPRNGSVDAVCGGSDLQYLRRTCEQSLKNLGIEALDVFCMSRVDPNVPIEDSVGGMAELVQEGKTRFISLSECSAPSLKCGNAAHPLASLQMEYSLFSRDAEEQGQIDACKELGLAMMAYAVLGRGILSAEPPRVQEISAKRRSRAAAALRERQSREESSAALGTRGRRTQEERHARPAGHRLANRPARACGSLHRTDTGCKIA
jgi:aryl-alcohol dehydrogenase-like predicted oxidoreductase